MAFDKMQAEFSQQHEAGAPSELLDEDDEYVYDEDD